MAEDRPFKPSFGNRPDALIGRDGVIADFRDGLAGPPGARERATLLIGQRGMGKTALLLEFAEMARGMDFVTASVTAGDKMLDEIVQLIQKSGARTSGKGVKAVSASAFGFSVGLTFTDEVKENYGFRMKMSLLCDALAKQGQGVLVLVDEVQSSSPEMRELAATYQHLVGEDRNVAIAMAGLPSAVSDVLNDDVLTFLNRARQVELGPLPLGEVAVHYSKELARLGRSIDADLLDEAVQATRGYPYLLQLIGYYLLKLAGDGQRISSDMVELAVKSAKRDLVATVYKPALKPLSRKDMAFLRAMSQDEGASSIADIRARLGDSQASVQQQRSRLMASGVIASERRGQVAYTLPYMREYLRDEL